MGEYCHGIIGMQKPGSDLALWKQRMINSSLLFNYDGSYDLSKKYIEGSDDYGKFITVVGSWVNHIIDDKTEYETSGASVYAGLLASLDSSESPTNKSVDGILPVEVFESDDLDDLAEAGFTMFRSTIRNGVCPYEAVSFAGPSSDFHSVANIRILNDTCNRIQRAIDIGDTIGKATAEDKARSVLSDMVRDKEIRDFSLGSEILTANKIALYIEIYPFFYVSSISTSIKVNTIGE
jgi:hypothetical protein